MVWSNEQQKTQASVNLLDKVSHLIFELKIDVFVRKLNVFQIRSDVFIGDYFSIKQQNHLQPALGRL